jgi:hypothetical protein
MSNASDFTVRSADGTTIGAERVGEGPPVVLIGGAFNDRTTTRALAQVLAPAFTAVSTAGPVAGQPAADPVVAR